MRITAPVIMNNAEVAKHIFRQFEFFSDLKEELGDKKVRPSNIPCSLCKETPLPVLERFF